MELFKKITVGVALYAAVSLLAILFLGEVIALDKFIFLAVNSFTNSLLNSAFFLITFTGSTVFWLLAIILMWTEKKKKVSMYLLIAFAIDSLSLALLKSLFYRPRPSQSLSGIKLLNFDIELGPSFPSGHTQRAFSGAVVLGTFFKKLRIPLIIIAVLVGISRIYTGAHFPLDVLAGAINGILLGMTALTFPYKRLQKSLESV
ncbi:MAG: phosphatase PAP2 family protein [Candidatus Aenigmatarchaeota archaeon]